MTLPVARCDVPRRRGCLLRGRLHHWDYLLRGWGIALVAVGVSVALSTFVCAQNAEPPAGPSSDGPINLSQEDFEFGRSDLLPADGVLVQSYYKPGHWTALSQQVVANNFDLRGELQLGPLELRASPYAFGTSRSFTLTRGRAQTVEQVFYPPEHHDARQLQLPLELRRSFQGAKLAELGLPVLRMPEHQFFMVVLTDAPADFAYLRTRPTVTRCAPQLISDNYQDTYRVILVSELGRPQLPRQWSQWSSTACLLWDDAPPERLDAEQQQAIIDWLHWGGHIVLSGAGTLERLEASFLAPYLPARPNGTWDIEPERLAELSAAWSGEHFYQEEDALWRKIPPLKPAGNWIAQQLVPAAEAEILVSLADQPLIVERRVGRGRVVCCGVSLRQPELAAWPGFDPLLHVALLRRPSRTKPGESFIHSELQEAPLARKVSDLRYLSRDAGALYLAAQAGLIQGQGPAGWSSFSPLSGISKDVLRTAAGLTIPPAEFVIGLLSIYLVVLIPVNWLVFRLLGRVEWAWAAAPVITIVFSLAVVQLARLNIGFASAANQVNVLEIQGEFSRAHVTRYTSLYSSISTNYQLTFDDPGGVALPLAANDAAQTEGLLRRRQSLFMQLGGDPQLVGFHVASNSLGMLHAEHMLDLGGGIRLSEQGEQLTVANRGNYPIEHAVLVYEGKMARVGMLPAGGQQSLAREALRESVPYAGPEQERPFDITPLWDALQRQTPDMTTAYLIGVLPLGTELPGMTIAPQTTKTEQRTVVVAHLNYPEGPPPVPDVILMADSDLMPSELPWDGSDMPQGAGP